MMLSHLSEQVKFNNASTYSFGVIEHSNQTLSLTPLEYLREFRLEMGLPVWQYQVDGLVLEKRVFLPHQQNTVHITYRMLEGNGPIQLKLRISVHFRGHDEPVSVPDRAPYILTASSAGRYELIDQGRTYPALRLCVQGNSSAFTFDEQPLPDIRYRVEAGRGYDNVGQMTSPGILRTSLSPGQEVTLTASTESWERILAYSPREAFNAEIERRRRLIVAAFPSAPDDFCKEMVMAADQFVISPATRVEDSARAEATGEQARTIIAGYHWFTDWGRDSMISLEGLTLVTGRHAEAGFILRTFLSHVRDGLIPNFFPDRSTEGVYHTADATLWFFHALSRYIAFTGDRGILRTHLSVLKEIIACHQRGTRFGIGVDPADGLLKQGAEGYQLTWMDAKVGDWVVTSLPRQSRRDQRAVVQRFAFARDLDAGRQRRRQLDSSGRQSCTNFIQ